MTKLSEGWRLLIAVGGCAVFTAVSTFACVRLFPTLNGPLSLVEAFMCVAVIAVVVWRPKIIENWRRARGQCLNCGYDLAHNESGICPECGTATKPRK